MTASVVIASNRGPVSFARSGPGFAVRRGAGGLAGALDPVARELGDAAIWLATAASADDRAAVTAGEDVRVAKELGYPMRLLDVEPDLYGSYYDSVSNRMLWFANHCLFDEVGIQSFGPDYLDEWDGAYKRVNELFAREIVTVAGPGSLVLVQDYHLALVPRLLRNDAGHTISHFTHSSFCGAEGLARLPERIRRELLEGLLGADLVGFHTPEWARRFTDACADLGAAVDWERGTVTLDRHVTWVRAYPIAIDCNDLRKRAFAQDATRWAGEISEAAELIVARADRAEPSKNIVRGFLAWRLLLERRGDLAERARFIACIYPSRGSMHEYQKYSADIHRVVDDINKAFPESIRLYDSDDFDRTLGALRSYDVLLVNPIMDGMNLVSKEGACLNEREGVIVLSRRAGSFHELGRHVVPVDDPLDVAETAGALEQAIDLPETKRRDLATAVRAAATRRSPADWIRDQLDDLEALRAGAPPVTPAS